MTEFPAEPDDASTPLTPEEREQLIPSYIALRGELNEAEQQNILEADAWAFSRKRDVLGERFLSTLHERMFGNVWRWAGKYRQSQKNIGIPHYDRFSWGSVNLVDAGQTRAAYVAALRAADGHDYGPLLAFVRS